MSDETFVRYAGVTLVVLISLLVFLIWSDEAQCEYCPDAPCSLRTEEICGECFCEIEEDDYIGRCEL